MKRWLAVAALVAAFLATPVWAQRRGGASTGGIGHGGFAAHGPVVSGHSSPVFSAPRPSVRSGTTFGTPFHRPPFYPNRFYSRRFYGYPWAYGYGYGYSNYVYPGFYGNFDGNYGDYEYPSAGTTYPGYNPSASYVDPNIQYQQQNDQQQDQIDRLENEVEQLRESRARSSAAANSQPQPATVLVFQDKHTEAVQNYAIVGETLWIVTEERARKVPISDLDIPATQKANEDRGVDFRLPE